VRNSHTVGSVCELGYFIVFFPHMASCAVTCFTCGQYESFECVSCDILHLCSESLLRIPYMVGHAP